MKKGILMQSSEVVEKRVEELKEQIAQKGVDPKLAIIRVGEDPASVKYVNNKIKMCEKVGVESFVKVLPENAKTSDVTSEVLKMVDNDMGVLVQLPLPKHIDEEDVLQCLPYWSDVDGFSEINLGKLVRGHKSLTPCTPKGIMALLKYYNIPLEGKDVVIINRSNIVGKPLALLMLQENATVTICHSKTKNLKQKVLGADIVVTGVGIPNFLGYDDFTADTTIIDVSINFDENGKMCGDVCKKDYEDLMKYKNCNITPVPGGVGLMTVLSLIENTIEREDL